MTPTASLAGRRGELRSVTAVLTSTSEVAAMLVVGEAGVGKTWLVAAAGGLAAQSDVTVLTGWCLRLSQGVPFLPVVDVLRGLGELDGGRLVKAALAECAAFVRGEVVRLMPDLEEPGEPARPVEAEDGWRRQRLFDALRRLFVEIAKIRRAAMLIEDVHWADATTFEFLDYLLAPGRASDIPIVLTCRDEQAPRQELTEWLERLQRNAGVGRLDLSPLTRAETSEQITLLLGEPPGRAFVDDTYGRSEGNAFLPSNSWPSLDPMHRRPSVVVICRRG